jgi:hypothetical protein
MVDCNIFGGPLLPMLRFRDVALGVVDNFYLCIREVSLPTNLCSFMLRHGTNSWPLSRSPTTAASAYA